VVVEVVVIILLVVVVSSNSSSSSRKRSSGSIIVPMCLLAVAQLVEALRYKSEVRGFDSLWCYWREFFIDKSFRPRYGPGVYLASDSNEYQEYFLGGKGYRCVGLTTLPTSCASSSWNPLGCPSPQWDCFALPPRCFKMGLRLLGHSTFCFL
jgi:hypothetical protein